MRLFKYLKDNEQSKRVNGEDETVPRTLVCLWAEQNGCLDTRWQQFIVRTERYGYGKLLIVWNCHQRYILATRSLFGILIVTCHYYLSILFVIIICHYTLFRKVDSEVRDVDFYFSKCKRCESPRSILKSEWGIFGEKKT